MILEMETVGQFFPATGRNTIRKLSDKYEGIGKGDRVRMKYVASRDEDAAVLGVELLVVVSVYVGNFTNVVRNAWSNNHAAFADEGECAEAIAAIYGYDNVEAVPDTETFLAISFR